MGPSIQMDLCLGCRYYKTEQCKGHFDLSECNIASKQPDILEEDEFLSKMRKLYNRHMDDAERIKRYVDEYMKTHEKSQKTHIP